eukprot:GHVU01137435.1.p1 GENE.GHVU01137435.1~~GHVU01137435.1.p1  ORF type:complete len:146 (-),score=18.22 GHVU01137435.1:401-838(-)
MISALYGITELFAAAQREERSQKNASSPPDGAGSCSEKEEGAAPAARGGAQGGASGSLAYVEVCTLLERMQDVVGIDAGTDVRALLEVAEGEAVVDFLRYWKGEKFCESEAVGKGRHRGREKGRRRISGVNVGRKRGVTKERRRG